MTKHSQDRKDEVEPLEGADQRKANIDISVIICTREREKSLSTTLTSLQNLRLAADLTYEFLLIDNGSSDKTRELVHSFMGTNPEIYRYYFEPRKGKSNALNLGIRNARGKIIAFTDDDVIVDPNWLQKLWDAFVDNEHIVAVQGRILLQRELGTLPPWIEYANLGSLLILPYYDPSASPSYCETLVGANMAFRREVFETYGLFDPQLGPGASGFGEETDLGTRLRDAHKKILFQPAATVFHEYCEERFTWDFWEQRIDRQAHGDAIVDTRKSKVKRKRHMRMITSYLKYWFYRAIRDTKRVYKYHWKYRYNKSYISKIKTIQRTY